MSQRTIRTVCLLASLAIGQSASAQVRCKGTAAPSFGYCFVSDLVTALTMAHIAALTQPDTAQKPPNVLAQFADLLYMSGRQRQGIEQAVRILAPHVSSPDSSVRASASNIVEALRLAHRISLTGDSVLRAFLDQKAGGPSAQAQSLADLKTRRSAASMMLSLSTIDATETLLETNPRDTEHMRLNMRARDRDSLREQIRLGFGLAAQQGAPNQQVSTDYSAAALVIDKFLTDKWPTQP